MVNQGMVLIKRMKVSQVLSRSRQIKVSLGRGYNYIKVKYWCTSKFRFSSSIQMKAEDVTVNQGIGYEQIWLVEVRSEDIQANQGR